MSFKTISNRYHSFHFVVTLIIFEIGYTCMFLLLEIKCKEQELLSCSLTELCLTFGITTVPEDKRSEDELVGNVYAFSG